MSDINFTLIGDEAVPGPSGVGLVANLPDLPDENEIVAPIYVNHVILQESFPVTRLFIREIGRRFQEILYEVTPVRVLLPFAYILIFLNPLLG
jgi:hypothetical protein